MYSTNSPWNCFESFIGWWRHVFWRVMAFHPLQEVQQQQLHWLHLELNGWVSGICFNFTKFVVPFPVSSAGFHAEEG